jgi:3-oxoacyl-[acyl-carrier-protein] synthase III
MKYSKILGTGSYLPDNIVTNQDLEAKINTTHEWIFERTGIAQRHIAAPTEDVISMAELAARQALAAANLKPEDIGMIIIATTTPTMIFPGSACLLQAKLGIAGCPAFDLNSAACAGFMYGFSIADQYIRTGCADNILVIGSEVMTRVVDWQDRSTCVLFGDGAGAVILGASTQPGIISTHLHADGRYQEVLHLPLASLEAPDASTIKMRGNQLFKLAVNTLDKLFDETLAANNIANEDIDWLVPHQANVRIIQAMAKKLNLPLEKAIITLAEQGNTSSASIPLALDKAIRSGKIKPGQMVLMEGFGGGLAWGSALMRY